MIKSFKHRGLRSLYDGDRSDGLNPVHVPKLRGILAVLNQSTEWQGMDIPVFRLHPLAGQLQGHYAVSVSANWRATFRFEGGNAHDVDYLDYH